MVFITITLRQSGALPPLTPARGRPRGGVFLSGGLPSPPVPPSSCFSWYGLLPPCFLPSFSPGFHRRLGCFYRRLGCFYRHIVCFFLAYLGFFLYLCSIVIKLIICLIRIYIKMIFSRLWMLYSRVCRVPFLGLVVALFQIVRFFNVCCYEYLYIMFQVC